MYREKIEAWFADKQEDMLADIAELVAIRSVREDEEAGKPFGAGPFAALVKAAEIASRLGLTVKEHEGYAVTADAGPLPARLGILGHVDVVEEGSGWSVPPFQATLRDGYIFGRGAADDKGPVVAALYAARAAQELCPELAGGVRIIIGSAEETTCEDLAYYRAKEELPPMVFSPDADFPVIHAEKGIHAPKFCAAWEEETALPRVLSIKGGSTKNAVPAVCEAVVQGLSLDEIRQYCGCTAKATGVSLRAEPGRDETVQIRAEGTACHACAPEEGCNAQTAMLELLATLPLAEGQSSRTIRALNSLFPHGDIHGKAMGIACRDEETGLLTLAFSVLELGPTGFTAQYDCRCPLDASYEYVAAPAERRLKECGFEVYGGDAFRQGHYTPPDSLLCQTLNAVYEAYTGLPGGCQAIGGYTYVHDIPGGVAFGCAMPGAEPHFHDADERIRIDDLMLSAKMFTEAIIRLCR